MTHIPLASATRTACIITALVACGCASSTEAVRTGAPAATTPNSAIAPRRAPSEPPTADRPASAFSVVAEGDYTMHVHPLGERVFVSGAPRLLLLEGNDLVIREELTKGIAQVSSPLAVVTAMAGLFPDAAWMTVATSNGRTGFGVRYRWQKDEWKQLGPVTGQVDLGVFEWTQGRLLTFKVSGAPFGPMGFQILSGAPAAAPRVKRLKNANKYCPDGFSVGHFRAFPSGAIFLIGTTCEEPSKPIVQRWPNGSAAPLVEALPARAEGTQPGAPGAFHAASPEDAWVAMTDDRGAYLAHFDGTRWAAEPSPTELPITALAGTANGELWLAASKTTQVDIDAQTAEERTLSELWRKAPGAAWRSEPLPPSLRAASVPTSPPLVENVVARAPDDVWLEARYCDKTEPEPLFDGRTIRRARDCRFAILRTIPSDHPLTTFPEPLAEEPFSLRRATPLVGECVGQVFVVLYRLARSAPANFDFPDTRAALKGHTELAEDESIHFVETEEDGRRYFGALLQSESTARRLATLITQRVPGSTPQIFCGDPQIRRILDIDLATGALRGEHRPAAP